MSNTKTQSKILQSEQPVKAAIRSIAGTSNVTVETDNEDNARSDAATEVEDGAITYSSEGAREGSFTAKEVSRDVGILPKQELKAKNDGAILTIIATLLFVIVGVTLYHLFFRNKWWSKRKVDHKNEFRLPANPTKSVSDAEYEPHVEIHVSYREMEVRTKEAVCSDRVVPLDVNSSEIISGNKHTLTERQKEEFLLLMVDVIDELSSSKIEVPDQKEYISARLVEYSESTNFGEFMDTAERVEAPMLGISQYIEICGYKIIDSRVWDSERMRSINKLPEGDPSKWVVRTISRGLLLQPDKILRKQEVNLEIKYTN